MVFEPFVAASSSQGRRHAGSECKTCHTRTDTCVASPKCCPSLCSSTTGNRQFLLACCCFLVTASVLMTCAPIHQATKQLAVSSLRQNVAARRMMSFSSTASSAPSRSSSSSSDKALKRVVHRLAATLPHHGVSGGSRSAVPLNSSCVHGNRAAFSTVALSTRVADASSNRSSSSSHSSVPKRFASTHRQLRKCEWCHSCTPLSLQRLTAPFVVIVCTQQPQRMASPPSFSGC